jgi:cell division protease FtsH
MVCEWGMSPKLGPIHYSAKEENVFLGRDFGKPREHSESIQAEIDAEVRRILDEQYGVAKRLITENVDALKRLAAAVLERETLDAEEIDQIIKGETLAPPPSGPKSGSGSSTSTVSVAA